MEPDVDGEPTIAFLTIRELDTLLGRHGHPQLLALIDYQRHVFAKGRFDGYDPSKSTLNHLAFEIQPERYEAERVRLDGSDARKKRWTGSSERSSGENRACRSLTYYAASPRFDTMIRELDFPFER